MNKAKLNKAIKSTKAFLEAKEAKTVKCPNQHCDEGVVDVIFGEKQFCGICDGEGVIDEEK